MGEKIKLSYNPYEQISAYEIFDSSKNTWKDPSPESCLKQPKHITGSLQSHIEETIKEISKEYGDSEILFEGTDADFDLLENFVTHSNEKITCKKK